MRFLKRLALILSLVMVTSIFAACSKNSNKEAESSKKTAQNENKKDKDHENTQEQASDDVDSLEELSIIYMTVKFLIISCILYQPILVSLLKTVGKAKT